jgi:crossover junction endodeoxyribonuclease RusA
VNSYWLTSGKRRYISKRGLEFKRAVAEICADLPSFLDAPVQVEITLYPRNKRLLDIDNVCKGVLDGLQDAGMFEDDSQVWKLTVERGATIKDGGCTVVISQYAPTI